MFIHINREEVVFASSMQWGGFLMQRGSFL